MVEGQEVNLKLGSAVTRADFSEWLYAEGMLNLGSWASADHAELLLSFFVRRALTCIEAKYLCLKRVLFYSWVCHHNRG